MTEFALKQLLSELELYKELEQCLTDSFDAFVAFQKKASEGALLSFSAACDMPGWQEYVELVALPLNRKTMRVIMELSRFSSGIPSGLQSFVVYHYEFESAYRLWQEGKFPAFPFLSGRFVGDKYIPQNFPLYTHNYVAQRISELENSK